MTRLIEIENDRQGACDARRHRLSPSHRQKRFRLSAFMCAGVSTENLHA